MKEAGTMKRFTFCVGFCALLFLCIGISLSYGSLEYTFSSTKNVYKTDSYWTHNDNSKEHFDFTYIYYKLPRKAVFEIKSDRGQHGIIEGKTSPDPMLYDSSCASAIKKHCPLLDWEPDFKDVCGQAVIKQFMGSGSKRASVRQEYEAAKQADLQFPPEIISPEDNSSQAASGKTEIELGLKKIPVTPCKWWTFTVVFDRWDESAGSNGEWKSGPFSYTSFQGFEHEEGGTVYCRAKYFFDFKPGKYRFRAKAQNADGRKLPWTPWSTFSIKLAVSPNIPSVLNITSPGTGESFFIGEIMRIRWQGLGIDQRIKIGLIQGGNITPVTTANGVENKGYWRWIIPSSVKPGKYRLAVATLDNSQKDFVNNIKIKMKVDIKD